MDYAKGLSSVMKTNSQISFLIFLFLLGSLSLTISGCSSKKVNEGNPEEVFNDAEDDIKDKHFLSALEKMKTVKNKFPYSAFSTKASLRVADIYFLEESFVEAAATYEAFQDLHPKYEKADYVVFQIGESYFNQLPGGIDRDLTPATKAYEAYTQLEKLYPQSEYLAKARDQGKRALNQLALKERYIADFYFKQDMYDSAASRYEKITKKYPGTETDEFAYDRWSTCLIRLNKGDEAKHVLKVYLNRYPSGSYASSAAKQLKSLEMKEVH